MTDPTAFAKLVPGFDFLQGLVKNASAALPDVGKWIAPTLDPQELAKRIEELRTVQFWLEQNAKLLGTTIQALEVQRMTLSTLKTMNVSMDGLREVMTLKPAAAAVSTPTPAAAPAPTARRTPASRKQGGAAGAAAAALAAPPAALVDPMQWWGALTQQFGQLATAALQDSAADAAKTAAKGMATAVVQQGMDVANQALKKVTGRKAR